MPFTAVKLHTVTRRLIPAATFALLLLLAASPSFSQSIDLNSPTPVVSNEIAGSIAPLDIGDARSTRFFYTFNGLQGDLELTVESFNLEGDVDIFLAGNMRPLTKVTLYAGAGSTRSTKTVYLRRDEPLILRVQARTPNDAEGTYRIRFGGAFRPAARLAAEGSATDESTAANPSPGATTTTSANRKGKRVSSVGARIEEPVVEIAKEEPTPEATPEPMPAPKKPAANPRPARTRAGARRTSRAESARKTSPKTDAEGADASKAGATDSESNNNARNDSEATEKPAEPKPERPRPVRVPRARGNRSSTAARRTTAPPAESVPASPAESSASPAETNAPPAPVSARLVLVMRDGETFERDMAGIRRVTVENGVLIIVSKNGKTERQPMTAVLRMSIEP
ncbi:MAG: hypothetical protein QOE47_697 [Pyrinomonadaceae bacterium]|nr:hypothetical protein [Pyrinomonadaceae bacterium]